MRDLQRVGGQEGGGRAGGGSTTAQKNAERSQKLNIRDPSWKGAGLQPWIGVGKVAQEGACCRSAARRGQPRARG
jgi:hypothetical protein